jgi:hypothetical protein
MQHRTTIHSPDAADPFLSVLFQPSAAYDKPSDVLKDDDLTLYEKKGGVSVLGVRRVGARIRTCVAGAHGLGGPSQRRRHHAVLESAG